MDFLVEKALCRGLEYFLGKEVWASISKARRLAILELVERFSIQVLEKDFGIKEIKYKEIEEFVKCRLQELDRQEYIALLKDDIKSTPDLNIENYNLTKTLFERKRKIMFELLETLQKLSFKNKDIEERRLKILEAVKMKANIPVNHPRDLWILNHVVPGILSEEENQKIKSELDAEEKV